MNNTNTNQVNTVMWTVVLASMLPTICYWWFWGWGIIWVLVLAICSAMLFEILMLKLRKLPTKIFALDGSIVVSAITLGLCLPPNSPWWIVIIGTFVAVVLGKHLYGGIGFNIFNPAMLAYIFLLISFPLEMARFQAPLTQLGDSYGFLDSLKVMWLGFDALQHVANFDAITAATPLDDNRKIILDLKAGIVASPDTVQLTRMLATPYLWLSLAFIAAGCVLLYKKIIRWHIPVTYIVCIFVMSSLFNIIDPIKYAGPTFQLINGGIIFAAFFLMTDPVTVSTTPLGRIIFAVGAAVLTLSIRYWGVYPDGVAFSILLMNMMVPLIDSWTKKTI